MNIARLAPLAALALAALLSTCSWDTSQRRPQMKIPDPARCEPDGVPCGAASEGLCCNAKTQKCCTDVVQPYCGSTCP